MVIPFFAIRKSPALLCRRGTMPIFTDKAHTPRYDKKMQYRIEFPVKESL
jgi:hypothetical protein